MPDMIELPRIDIVSDAICPWCYIGKRQLEAALAQLAREGQEFAVAWHPFQLNPDMPEAGVPRAEYRTRKFGSVERSAQLDAQVTAAAASVGLEFQMSRLTRTPNTVAAHRLARWALARGYAAQDAVIEAMFHGYFVEGQDIGDRAVLAGIAASAGLPRDEAAAYLAGDDGAAEVRAEDAAFRNAGLSGVPSFVMRGHVLFSGALPADTMAEAFAKAWAVLGKAAA